MTSWTVIHAQFSQVSASWTILQDGLIFPREAGPLDLHVKTLSENQFATLIRSRSPPLGSVAEVLTTDCGWSEEDSVLGTTR